MEEIKIKFDGPIYLIAEERASRAPKELIRMRIRISNGESTFGTETFVPMMDDDKEQSLIAGSFRILRALCIAATDPEAFRKSVETGDPNAYGHEITVAETDLTNWIDGAKDLKKELLVEVCPVAQRIWDGEEVSFDLPPEAN